ncbi:MAG TPA: class III lanthipeptide [Solirubrobacteraceae bacterium]|jgi:hypothetical protein|nr:class III lanthipeptide [Solirubrobacteraceae bacterium]
MAILDLQGLPAQAEEGKAAHSGASKGCNNHSGLSLLLCA